VKAREEKNSFPPSISSMGFADPASRPGGKAALHHLCHVDKMRDSRGPINA